MSDTLIGDLDPTMVPEPPRQPEPAAADPGKGMVTLTEEQFAEILKQNRDEAAKQQEEILRHLLHPQVTTHQAPDLPDVSLNLDGLPDPAYDRDGFMRGLGERHAAALKQIEDRVVARAQHTVSSAKSQEQLENEAWGRMQELYPELVGNERLVASVADSWKMARLSNGADPAADIRRDFDGTVRAIGGAAMEMIEGIRGAKGETDDPPAPANRTGGIPGSRPRGPARQAPTEGPGLVDSLKDFQSRARIY